MIDLALDPSTGDLQLFDFDLGLIEGVDQIAQNLAIRLRFIRGEWYLNILAGLPYFEYFFIKEPNQIQIETFLTNEIANTRGILEITSFSSNFDGFSRNFSVDFACNTVFGLLTMEQTLP